MKNSWLGRLVMLVALIALAQWAVPALAQSGTGVGSGTSINTNLGNDWTNNHPGIPSATSTAQTTTGTANSYSPATACMPVIIVLLVGVIALWGLSQRKIGVVDNTTYHRHDVQPNVREIDRTRVSR